MGADGTTEPVRSEGAGAGCVPCALDEPARVVGSNSAMLQAEAKAIERLERKARDTLACSKTPVQRDVESEPGRRELGACDCTIKSPLEDFFGFLGHKYDCGDPEKVAGRILAVKFKVDKSPLFMGWMRNEETLLASAQVGLEQEIARRGIEPLSTN